MKANSAVASRKRRKKVLSKTKGMQKAPRSGYKLGKQAVSRSLQYSYRDRRNRKRDFRSLWITRISAACKANNTSYSKLMLQLKSADLKLDRKSLAYLAAEEPAIFAKLVKEIS